MGGNVRERPDVKVAMRAAPPAPAGGARTGRQPVGWFEVVASLVVAAVGAVLLGVGSWLPVPGPHLVGGNLPVNAGATDLRDVTSNNSPSLARNPADSDNLAVANRIDTLPFSCALHVSLDGGARWSRRDVPFPAGEEQPPRCFAPDVAFGPDGTLYVSYVTLKGPGNNPNALWLSSSRNGGRTLATPMRVSGPLSFQVRLSADPDRAGRLYLSWVQASATGNLGFASTDNPVVVVRSDDGGTTWTAPVRVNPASRPHALVPSTAVGRDGDVDLLYLDVGADALDYFGAHAGLGGPPYSGRWQLVLARSSDRGTTWRETAVGRDVVPADRFVSLFPPFPALAVDRRGGTVYVAFHDARSGDADVWLWTSRDGGMSFAAPVRVNDTPSGDGTSQNLPQLAVAPNGRLDVLYYDRRRDRANVMTDVSLQSSQDHGRTFGPSLRLSDRSFDSRVGFGNLRGLPELGSRLGLVSTDGAALAVWADSREGTAASLKQDIARQFVVFPVPSPLRDPLRFGGAGLAPAGLLVAAAFAVRRAIRRQGRGGFGRP